MKVYIKDLYNKAAASRAKTNQKKDRLRNEIFIKSGKTYMPPKTLNIKDLNYFLNGGMDFERTIQGGIK